MPDRGPVPVPFITATGSADGSVEPSPRLPPPLAPQHRAWPLASTAQKLSSPPSKELTPPRFPVPMRLRTTTGRFDEPPCVPSPSWPLLSYPQQRTSPPISRAHVV